MRDELRRRRIGKLDGQGARLLLQLEQHLVDRLLAQVHSALERGIDLDVEPGLDRSRDELHRYRVHDEAGQQRERGEAQE